MKKQVPRTILEHVALLILFLAVISGIHAVMLFTDWLEKLQGVFE